MENIRLYARLMSIILMCGLRKEDIEATLRKVMKDVDNEMNSFNGGAGNDSV